MTHNRKFTAPIFILILFGLTAMFALASCEQSGNQLTQSESKKADPVLLAKLSACMKLCNPNFLKTATAEDTKAEIAKGADLEVKIKGGFTPLHFATQFGNAETVTALLNAGADTEAKTDNEVTALHLAAASGNTETVIALLKAGANTEDRGKIDLTPLYIAANNGHTETVTALLKAGANGKVKTNDGYTPFDLVKDNEELDGTDAYWMLNDARY